MPTSAYFLLEYTTITSVYNLITVYSHVIIIRADRFVINEFLSKYGPHLRLPRKKLEAQTKRTGMGIPRTLGPSLFLFIMSHDHQGALHLQYVALDRLKSGNEDEGPFIKFQMNCQNK